MALPSGRDTKRASRDTGVSIMRGSEKPTRSRRLSRRRFLGNAYTALAGIGLAHLLGDELSGEESVGEVVDRLCYGRDPAMAKARDIPFYGHQTKRVLRNVGRVDPQCIEDAIGRGVYGAAATALSEMQPDEVVEEVTASAIRGRGGGGAGAPAGLAALGAPRNRRDGAREPGADAGP